MNKIYKYLVALELFIGIGAMGGGLPIVIDPSGKIMGVSVDMLAGSPFNDFLFPGLFLFLINGICNVIAGITALKKFKYQSYLSGALGVALVSWIVIQCIVIRSVHFLHILFFVLGLLLMLLSLLLAIKQKLFPLNLVIK